MKHIKLLLLALATLCFIYALTPVPAVRGSAQITFRVIDDAGAPVADAVIGMSTFDYWQPGEGFGRDINKTYTGSTDNAGLVVLNGQSIDGAFSYGPRAKEGFYAGGGGQLKFIEMKNGRWEPWNPTLEIVIKRILNPIPMYARSIGRNPLVSIPKSGPAGFDLMEADWVSPYGKGRIADLIFELLPIVPLTDPTEKFEYIFTITFSNKGDGIHSIIAPKEQASVLRLPRFAPVDNYEEKLVRKLGRLEKGKAMYPSLINGQSYFIRVRTVLDEKGNIKSALYGKIIDEISCDVINHPSGFIQFKYYLNPTPLDQNMEFDVSKNLFGELPFEQRVRNP